MQILNHKIAFQITNTRFNYNKPSLAFYSHQFGKICKKKV